jgi:hypothetical protein
MTYIIYECTKTRKIHENVAGGEQRESGLIKQTKV